MAQSSACCSPRQNHPFDGKDEFTAQTPIKGNTCRTLALAATLAFTLALALDIALLVASGSVDSSVVRYSEDDL